MPLFFLVIVGVCISSTINTDSPSFDPLRVEALRCLSCVGVEQPYYCNIVRYCDVDGYCAVQKYRTAKGEILYDLDCALQELCHPSITRRAEVSTTQSLCGECCTGDFCNTHGCGSQEYPSVRGPVCFSCQQVSNPLNCEHLDFCNQGEVCSSNEEMYFGHKFFSSKCATSYECKLFSPGEIAIGKRVLSRTLCNKCCHGDFCNQACSNASEVVTSPTSQVPTNGMEVVTLIFPDNPVTSLLVATNVSGTYTLEGPLLDTKSGYLSSTSMTVIDLKGSPATRPNTVESKGILLTTTVPVSTYMFLQGDADGTFLMETKYCGKNYILPVYDLAMISLNDDTRVEIFLNASGSRTQTLFLNRLQTFVSIYPATAGLMKISASKPICLINHLQHGDALLQMDIPIEQFSEGYIVPLWYTFNESEFLMITSNLSTNLHITPSKGEGLEAINAFGSRRSTLQDTVVVISSNPILVTAVYYSNTSYVTTLIPSVDSYRPWYMFAVPAMGFTSRVTIVVPTTRLGGLYLDNHQVDVIQASVHTVTYKGTLFSIFASPVSPGSHVMMHRDNVPFGLYVYGQKLDDVFGYVAVLAPSDSPH